LSPVVVCEVPLSGQGNMSEAKLSVHPDADSRQRSTNASSVPACALFSNRNEIACWKEAWNVRP
jgi:hypothetical protein